LVEIVSQRIELSNDHEVVQQYYLKQGWSDGLPVVPPTPERVESMLSATGLDSQHVVAEIPPNWGAATVEKLAINAVMAGCLPEYLPVLIAAVEAMSDPAFNLYAVQATTHSCAPLVIINGPIREPLGVNSLSGCYGPGWRANATIGRAVRLALLNIGGARPGAGDMSTQGAPSKYSYCVAENEEQNPWEPLHVERGFQPGQNTVTVLAGEPPHNINDHTSQSAEEVLTIIAGAMAVTGANNAYTGGETLLALGPEHAATIAKDGFTKQDIREWLGQHALVPLERYTHDTLVERFGRVPDSPIPMVRTPEDLAIIVLGGPGKHSSWVPTFGGTTRSVTREIK
jgi:quercetin dioxygenase-like cupin family protein